MLILNYRDGSPHLMISKNEYDKIMRYCDKHKKDPETVGVIEALCAINDINYITIEEVHNTTKVVYHSPKATVYWNSDKTQGIIWSAPDHGHLLSAKKLHAIIPNITEVIEVDFNEAVWGKFPTQEEFQTRKNNLFYIQGKRMDSFMNSKS